MKVLINPKSKVLYGGGGGSGSGGGGSSSGFSSVMSSIGSKLGTMVNGGHNPNQPTQSTVLGVRG